MQLTPSEVEEKGKYHGKSHSKHLTALLEHQLWVKIHSRLIHLGVVWYLIPPIHVMSFTAKAAVGLAFELVLLPNLHVILRPLISL